MTYVTAGYPTAEDTVDILLGMEAGGAGEERNVNCQLLLTKSQMSSRWAFPSQTQLQMARRSRKPILLVYTSFVVQFTLQVSDYRTASPQERNHHHLDPRDGAGSQEKGPESTNPFYGILQPDAEIRRGETSEGLPRGRREWLYRR